METRVSIVVLIAFITACGGTTDEQRIRAVITAAEEAAEARDTSDVLKQVVDDYSDGQGFGKEQLRDFLRAYFLTHPKIELLVNVGEIEFPARDLARVQVQVTMLGTRGAGGERERLTGDAQALRIELQLRDSEWRVTRVDRVME